MNENKYNTIYICIFVVDLFQQKNYSIPNTNTLTSLKNQFVVEGVNNNFFDSQLYFEQKKRDSDNEGK